jgi:hypothetical protein
MPPSSQRAEAISVPKRMWSRMPYSRAQASSCTRGSLACGDHFRVQSVFCANEKQYANDGTSHAAPG